MKKIKLIILAFAIAFSGIYAQVNTDKDIRDYVDPEELVTLSEDISFNDAVSVLSKISEKMTGKKIVSTVHLNAPLGLEIKNLPYWKALIIITQYHNLKFEERESVIVIQQKHDPNKELPEDIYADVGSREVEISAILFEANVQKMREQGINWEMLLSQNGLSIGSGITTFTEGKQTDQTAGGASSQSTTQKTPEFTISPEAQFTVGNFTGSLTAVFKFFETENLGEIISRPSITVRDKKAGRIQIGSDISIKQRDFAGNVIDVFYSTGTIIEVTPYIYNEDGIDYILLKLKVERSSAEPNVISTEIRKTTASTEVLMLNGEQTVIGGLLVNEKVTVRRGIPFLKDLPWWVFGIRYLAGYNEDQNVQKEVIILIKSVLVPTLKERIKNMRKDKFFRERIKNHNDLDYYKKETDKFNKMLEEKRAAEDEKELEEDNK
ncbi:MAG: type II and III secretion system protein [Chlorobi bacterium]|nr:type II and III secretion system protein [Chlorobiota bacterium]